MFQKIKSFLRNDDPLTQIKWSLYGRVWRECGLPYWKWLVAGIICTVLAACAEGYSVTLIGKIVDKGIAEQKKRCTTHRRFASRRRILSEECFWLRQNPDNGQSRIARRFKP